MMAGTEHFLIWGEDLRAGTCQPREEKLQGAFIYIYIST